jgi:RNA polymerase sigma factor (sigma-70 family)
MEDSIEEWFEREILVHEKMLTRYLLRAWSLRQEVPDLRQDTYVRVYEASTHTRPSLPKAFLFATARHLMIDRLRSGRIIFIGAQADLDRLNVLVDDVSPERRVTSMEEFQRLAAAFDGLPTQCRTVMWLRKVEQLSQKEVAAKLGVREKAIEKQVSRGMRLLTSRLLADVDTIELGAGRKPASGEASRG